MKNIFLLIIFLSCAVVGIMIRKYYKKRKNFYSETFSFLRKVKDEISFKKNFFRKQGKNT